MELLQNILLVFSFLLLIVLAIRAKTRFNVPGIPALFAMIVFFIVWVVGDLVEANAPNFTWMLWGRNIQQIGVFFTPLCALYFSIDYTANKRMRLFAYAMTVVQSISLFLIFTDQSTHLMRKSMEIQKDAVFGQALTVHSTSLGSVLIAFNFCLPLIALILLSLFARRVSSKLRRPLWMVITSIFLTLFVAALQSTVLSDVGITIPIPILNLPCVILLFNAVLHGGFLGLSPTVFHKVFEVIDQGIIVLNTDGLVTEYNGRAAELITIVSDSPSLKIGSDITTFFEPPHSPGKKDGLPAALPSELSSLQRNMSISLTCHALDDPGGKPQGYVLVLTDITSLKRRAELDPLTGVYNREGLTNAFADFQRNPDSYSDSYSDSHSSVSAMIIDLDCFKEINDTYGHFAGDKVLLDLVGAAQTVLSGKYMLGRLGGDEFVVVLSAEAQEAFELSVRLRKYVAERNVRYLDKDIQYTISIGVAAGNAREVSLPALLDKADQALYRAKQQGKNKASM